MQHEGNRLGASTRLNIRRSMGDMEVIFAFETTRLFDANLLSFSEFRILSNYIVAESTLVA